MNANLNMLVHSKAVFQDDIHQNGLLGFFCLSRWLTHSKSPGDSGRMIANTFNVTMGMAASCT